MTRRFLRLLPLLWLALWLLTSCGKEDDYYYPSVRLEFLTAHTGARGQLAEVHTDGGLLLPVAEDASGSLSRPDSTLRIVANYTREETPDGTEAVRLYAAQTTVSPLPLPAEQFEEGVKTDPASVLSIWLGLGYLNIVLEVKTGGGSHAFHFVEEDVRWGEAARREVDLSLYHDAGGDPPYYTRRAYLSIPLYPYTADGAESVSVRFSLRNDEGETESYVFEDIGPW